jgi:hypothetical protein
VAATSASNPAYAAWFSRDQLVLHFMMPPDAARERPVARSEAIGADPEIDASRESAWDPVLTLSSPENSTNFVNCSEHHFEPKFLQVPYFDELYPAKQYKQG